MEALQKLHDPKADQVWEINKQTALSFTMSLQDNHEKLKNYRI